MREIRFRVWDKKEKKWVWGPGYEVNLFGEIIIMGELMKGISIERLGDMEALQFTGLKDKNKKEIYEGDIIKAEKIRNNYCEMPDLEIGEVFYSGGFYAVRGDYDSCELFDFESHQGRMCCKVIGNIYEHPELLK